MSLESREDAEKALQRLEENTLSTALRNHGINDRVCIFTPAMLQKVFLSEYLLHPLTLTPAAMVLQGSCRRVLALNSAADPEMRKVQSGVSLRSLVTSPPPSFPPPLPPGDIGDSCVIDVVVDTSFQKEGSHGERAQQKLRQPSSRSPRLSGPPDLFNESHGLIFPGSFKALDLLAISPSEQLGLKWHRVGSEKPQQGREITNAKLRKALKTKSEFAREEWIGFGIHDLRDDDFIRVGKNYFRPSEVSGGGNAAHPTSTPSSSSSVVDGDVGKV